MVFNNQVIRAAEPARVALSPQLQADAEELIRKLVNFALNTGDAGILFREASLAADATAGRLVFEDPYQIRELLRRSADTALAALGDKKFDSLVDFFVNESKKKPYYGSTTYQNPDIYRSRFSKGARRPDDPYVVKYGRCVKDFLDWAKDNKIGIFKKNQFAQFHPTLAKFLSDPRGKKAMAEVKKDAEGFFNAYLNITGE